MNNLIVRALSGSVYIALIIGAIFAGEIYFLALMLLFIILGMVELQKLLKTKSPSNKPACYLDIVVAMCTLIGVYGSCVNSNEISLSAFILAPFFYIPARMVVAVTQKNNDPTQSAINSVFSMVYVCIPLIMLWAAYHESWHLVMLTFVMIWLNDTGAYITGITFGKHKLCERLSPKKSWEGFWGGFVFCVAAGAAYSFILFDGKHWIMWCIYAALVSILSTYGDLFESMIKRYVGVKDSGNIIPGHGGILDRIDSLLAVAPLAFIMSILI